MATAASLQAPPAAATPTSSPVKPALSAAAKTIRDQVRVALQQQYIAYVEADTQKAKKLLHAFKAHPLNSLTGEFDSKEAVMEIFENVVTPKFLEEIYQRLSENTGLVTLVQSELMANARKAHGSAGSWEGKSQNGFMNCGSPPSAPIPIPTGRGKPPLHSTPKPPSGAAIASGGVYIATAKPTGTVPAAQQKPAGAAGAVAAKH